MSVISKSYNQRPYKILFFQFIGELYKLNMLSDKVMHFCIKKLIKSRYEIVFSHVLTFFNNGIYQRNILFYLPMRASNDCFPKLDVVQSQQMIYYILKS